MASTLADVLTRVLADPVTATEHAPTSDELLALGDTLDVAARAAAATGGWSPADPLRLAKARLRWLLACPRRALLDDDGGDPAALAVGRIVDAAAKLAALAPARPVDLDGTLAFLAALGDEEVAGHLTDADDAEATEVRADAAARVARLVDDWPTLDAGWWPRTEDPARVVLADGAVTVAGKLDLLLGGPPTDRPAVIVEVKSGRWHDAMRADAHLYALLVGLRDGRSPAAVVTVVADGTLQVEPVRRAAVAHAAERVEATLATAAALAAGAAPDTRPGSHCLHCPARPTCEDGRAWQPTDGATA